ncbi:MAG: acetate/propionate family kinase [Planctomycetia bacterium]|nr:acetate/propionate family kinase [Planctomycetia bacterium]
MKILVANIGSTSFKYKLFDMETETELASGRVERIGSDPAFPTHAEAVKFCLKDLPKVDAIGFKAVHGGRVTGVQVVTDDVLSAMRQMVDIAPAHNPPYIAAMESMRKQLPEVPLVAAFETGFHADIPECNRLYAVPYAWVEKYQIRRFGFHGASHRYIATRVAEIFGKPMRIISCHLGGSSSVCAIRDGKSVASSMGGSPQGGLPQNNRVGDFDPYLLPHLMKQTGKTCEEILAILGSQGGLLGLSGGLATDARDLARAASEGHRLAKLALDVYVYDIRRYIGADLMELGGADVLVFTGGIGENRDEIRAAVCQNVQELGIVLDAEKNAQVRAREACISTPDSRVQVWVIPTNEEIIVARQTQTALNAQA